jgi:hypothetical protein
VVRIAQAESITFVSFAAARRSRWSADGKRLAYRPAAWLGRTSLNANIDKLVAWAQAQEEVVKNAQANAREAALREIREAAASIR